MYTVAYRATERGIAAKNAEQWAEDRTRRMMAQRAAWEAEQAEREAKRLRAMEAEARRLAMAAELRAMGIALHIPYHTIEARALRVFKITRAELRSDRRHREIVFARQFIAYWAVRRTSLSLPQIARLMGGIDHTTVLHGKRTYPEKREKMGRYLRPAR